MVESVKSWSKILSLESSRSASAGKQGDSILSPTIILKLLGILGEMPETRLGAKSPNEKQPNFHLFYRSGFLSGLGMNKVLSCFQKLFFKKITALE